RQCLTGHMRAAAEDTTRWTEQQITDGPADLTGGAYSEGALTYTGGCGSPQAAVDLVTAIAQAANSQSHHPDVLWSYTEVTIDMRSHDVDGITPRDLRLAHSIATLAEEFEAKPPGMDE